MRVTANLDHMFRVPGLRVRTGSTGRVWRCASAFGLSVRPRTSASAPRGPVLLQCQPLMCRTGSGAPTQCLSRPMWSGQRAFEFLETRAQLHPDTFLL
jgi:hypothetical protein